MEIGNGLTRGPLESLDSTLASHAPLGCDGADSRARKSAAKTLAPIERRDRCDPRQEGREQGLAGLTPRQRRGPLVRGPQPLLQQDWSGRLPIRPAAIAGAPIVENQEVLRPDLSDQHRSRHDVNVGGMRHSVSGSSVDSVRAWGTTLRP
jgi:hypothetical protein